jgi:tRNA(Ile)-lysidine synthase
MKLEQSVEQRMRSLLSPQEKVLCAISGGPDSVALAHALKTLPFPLVLAHVDHQLRKTSARDARFVRTLAQRWDVPYYVEKVAVKAQAKKRGSGIEETARHLRYAALQKVAEKTKCSVIVTAHTADDQSETVLMNFLRGAGSTGLAGIPWVREMTPTIRLIRPFLEVERSEVMAYLKRHQLPYRTDPSNRSGRFTRNRIRHRLLPLLEKEYPGLRKRLVQTGEIFREESALWNRQIQMEFNKTVRQDNKKIAVDLTRLLGYHKAVARRILRHLLTGISFPDSERVFHLAYSPNGHRPIQLTGGVQVEKKGKELIIHSRGNYE